MKRLLLPLLAAIALPNTVNAEISDELHKKCLEARDYAGCVNTNKKLPLQKDKKISGIGISLFLNSDTAELTILSVIKVPSNCNKPSELSMKVLKGPKQIDREKTETIWDRFERLQRSLAPLRKSKQIKRGVYRIRRTSIERS